MNNAKGMKLSMVIALLFAMGLIAATQSQVGAISGEIRTRDGAPAVGVRVAAMLAGGSAATSSLFGITQTDAAGRYRLEDIPPGRYYIVAGPVEAPVYHPGVDGAAGATVVTMTGTAIDGLNFAVDLARLTPPPPRQPQFSVGIGTQQTCSSSSTAAPTQPLTSSDFVQLERTTCFGSCPAYSVRIFADGRVNWNGGQYVATSGAASATVAAEKARALIERYRTNGFWSLCDRYSAGVTDLPTFTTTVRINGQEKRVSNYAASFGNGAPSWLTDLEGEIDRLADTHRWIHGEPRAETFSYGNMAPDVSGGIKPGVTPLMLAAARGTTADVRALLASGESPNAQDSSGWTALMYAALATNADAVKALLDGGANPNAHSQLGQTPVMAEIAMAVQIRREPISALRLLLAAGADINAADNNGQTPLMMAIPQALNLDRDDTAPASLARANLIAFLRDSGARADLRNASGRTALDLLNEEARRIPNHPKAQYEKLRLILERSGGRHTPVQVRGVIRPRATELESLTLQRVGADPVRVTSPVGVDGSVQFPAVEPGVYSVLMTPVPSFPTATVPIAVPDTNVTDMEFAAPALRRIRVRAAVQGGGATPVFWLSLARRPETTSAPVTLPNRPNVPPLPANMTAALTSGARPGLIQVGGPVDINILSAVRSLLPSFYEQPVELAPLPDGTFEMILAEGDYVVAPLLSPPRVSTPRGAAPPATSAQFRITATSGGVDLDAQPLHVTGSGQEIQVTFVPVSP